MEKFDDPEEAKTVTVFWAELRHYQRIHNKITTKQLVQKPALPRGKGCYHVDISAERGTRAHGRSGGPRPGSEASWRNTPQSTMTLQVLSGVLLVCLGLLLGTTWTVQALQPKLRQQAEERRRPNEEWAAVRTAGRQQGVCPRCASPLSGWDWYFAPTLVEAPLDDD